MLTGSRPRFAGLERFGLNRRTLRELGDRPATVVISIPIPPYVYPTPAMFRRLIRKSPAARHALSQAWRARKLAQLKRELPSTASLEVVRIGRLAFGFRLTVLAGHIHNLSRLRHAESVEVTHISGMRAKKVRMDGPRLYAVKGRLVGQHEAQRSGFQLYEDRVVVLLAKSEKVAAARVARLLRLEQSPVLTTSGHYLRHKFDGILDVHECWDPAGHYFRAARFNPKGTEVWYELGRRKLRPGQEWRPSNLRRL
jgi:hypothetical protein